MDLPTRYLSPLHKLLMSEQTLSRWTYSGQDRQLIALSFNMKSTQIMWGMINDTEKVLAFDVAFTECNNWTTASHQVIENTRMLCAVEGVKQFSPSPQSPSFQTNEDRSDELAKAGCINSIYLVGSTVPEVMVV